MLRAPRRYGHFVYGVIQSGLTTSVAAAVASADLPGNTSPIALWLRSWLIAWVLMVPIVLLGAPIIRKMTMFLTRDDLT